VTSLAELCERLKLLYEGKFGKDNVKLIMDSKTVSTECKYMSVCLVVCSRYGLR